MASLALALFFFVVMLVTYIHIHIPKKKFKLKTKYVLGAMSTGPKVLKLLRIDKGFIFQG